MTSKVSISRCHDYHPEKVDAAVGRAVDALGGMGSFVRPGERVLIKPNMLAAKTPDKAVTTHPEVVRAVVRLVKEAGGAPVIGDSHALGSFARVSELTGIGEVASSEGAELVEFKDAVKVKGPGTFRQFELAREVVEADKVINLPKAKTHGQMLLTLAVKNLFGCVPGRRKVQWHFKAGVDRSAFASMLVEICGIVRPALSVVDAVVGMEGNGPGNGRPRPMGFVAAGADAVALDMVLAEAMCVPFDRLPTNRAAMKMGMGPSGLDDVEVVGDASGVGDIRVGGFRLPSASSLEWSIPEPMRRMLKDALTTRPDVKRAMCELCMACKEACPAGAIRRGGGAALIDYRSCIRCFCCQEVCPAGAIDVVEGWLLRLIG